MKQLSAIISMTLLALIWSLPLFAETLKPLGRADWNSFTETEKTAYLRGLYDANTHDETITPKKFSTPVTSPRQSAFLGALDDHFLGSSPDDLILDQIQLNQERRDREHLQALLKRNTPFIRALSKRNTLLQEDLTMLQEALDGFYTDDNNQRIAAPSALGLIVLAKQGVPEKDVQQLTEYIRANPVSDKANASGQQRRKRYPLAEYVSCPTGNACQLRIKDNVSLFYLWEVDAPQTEGQCPEETKQAKSTITALNDRLKTAATIEVQRNGMSKGKQLINMYVDGQNLNLWLIANKFAAKLKKDHNSDHWCP